jgi:hypothetical protein
MIILKGILKKQVVTLPQDRIQWGVSCEHDSDPSHSIKGGEFID